MTSGNAAMSTVANEGIDIYYEVHGEGGVPLVLLHGGLFDIEQQFAGVLPALSQTRQVIAIELQGHGHTADRDEPFDTARFARDVLAVMDAVGSPVADVFGFSVGGAVALELGVSHPERVRRLIVSSVAYRPDGTRGSQNTEAVGEMSVDMISGSPMEAAYYAKSPHPDREHLQTLLTKLGAFSANPPSWTDDQIRGIAAPTLITVGDGDMVRLEHAVEFFRLRGGDVNADFEGLPASQLAVLPGTSHFFGLAKPQLVLDIVVPFLDAEA